MQIKLSKISAESRYPFTHSRTSKSEIDLNLKAYRHFAQDANPSNSRGNYINELSAKIKLMEEKIKGKGDHISPGFLRNNEKVLTKRHLQRFSSFDGFPNDQIPTRPGFLQYSFQDVSEIKYLPVFQKERSVKKQRKYSNYDFKQLHQRQNSKQISIKRGEFHNRQKENALNTSIQIPLIQGLKREKQPNPKPVFSCSVLTREDSKANFKSSKQLVSPMMAYNSGIERKFSKNLQGIKNDKIVRTINKSLSLIQMINSIQDKKKKNKNQVVTEKRYFKEFELGVNLGKGKFGQVYLSRHIATGCIMALKKVMKNKLIEYNIVDQFIKEIKLHSSMDHPNIVRFYGFFEEKDSLYMVLEYMSGGTLFDYLNSVGSMNIREVVAFLRDVIQALAHMHERSIAHRDLKPQNVVITQGVAKLCDFGWAAVVQSTRKTYCGTLDYASPQVLERRSYDISVDIWSIGVLTYEMLMGKAPFQDKDRSVVRQRIVNSDKFELEYNENVPQQAQEFIQWLIQRDPQKRPKISELFQHRMFHIHPPNVTIKQHKKSL